MLALIGDEVCSLSVTSPADAVNTPQPIPVRMRKNSVLKVGGEGRIPQSAPVFQLFVKFFPAFTLQKHPVKATNI